MKKLCLVLVCAAGLGAFEPGILAAQPKQANVGRLKSEYGKFKEALKCLKQKGWKGCDKAQKKRIVAAGTVLAGLVIAAVGGVSFALWKMKRTPAEVGRKPGKKDVLEPDQRNISELFTALRAGETDKVKRLIGQDVSLINAKDVAGASLMLGAVRKNNQEVVRFLMEKGADVTQEDYSNASQEIKNLIDNFQKTMDVKIRNLSNVIQTGEIEKVMALVKKDHGLLNYRSHSSGDAPLHTAVLYQNKGLVRALLDEGAMVDVLSFNNVTPLHIAANQGHLQIARFLIEKGANVNRDDFLNWSPLTFAAKQGNEEMVKFLVEKGANIVQQDIDNAEGALKGFLQQEMEKQQKKDQ